MALKAACLPVLVLLPVSLVKHISLDARASMLLVVLVHGTDCVCGNALDAGWLNRAAASAEAAVALSNKVDKFCYLLGCAWTAN
jgi:hypothetical protein